jgi:GH24 family phage-related lysozyme (muramidase)
MSAASDMTASRIVASNSEGFRPDCYDDATGERLISQGQPTIGYGCRCRQWSPSFAAKVLALQVSDVDDELIQFPWYSACDDIRRAGLAEIAFNQGVSGLVRGYPQLIAAVTARDWPDAQVQCTVTTPNLQLRYAKIGRILLTGVNS